MIEYWRQWRASLISRWRFHLTIAVVSFTTSATVTYLVTRWVG